MSRAEYFGNFPEIDSHFSSPIIINDMKLESLLLAHEAGKAADVDEICAAVKKRNDEIGNMTDDFMNVLRTKHIPANLLILHEDKPGEAIVKAATKEKAGSIILGTRGLGKIRRTFLGSCSEYVVHHASCPVTVVRQQE